MIKQPSTGESLLGHKIVGIPQNQNVSCDKKNSAVNFLGISIFDLGKSIQVKERNMKQASQQGAKCVHANRKDRNTDGVQQRRQQKKKSDERQHKVN